MTRPVIILRPQPGAAQTASRVKARNMQAVQAPLFAIEARDWAFPDSADSLLLGSANAVRHAGDKLERLRALPCYAVGNATAKAAHQAGLDVRFSGSSDLPEALSRLVDEGWQQPLRLCGKQHTALPSPPHISIITAINYESCTVDWTAAQMQYFLQPAIILVHSARAMAQLEKVIMRCADDGSYLVNQHIIIAISARAAAKASLSWGKIAIAPMPSDHDMLKLAEKFCDKKDK
jgi:uroporphyrinogen-III synthase